MKPAAAQLRRFDGERGCEILGGMELRPVSGFCEIPQGELE